MKASLNVLITESVQSHYLLSEHPAPYFYHLLICPSDQVSLSVSLVAPCHYDHRVYHHQHQVSLLVPCLYHLLICPGGQVPLSVSLVTPCLYHHQVSLSVPHHCMEDLNILLLVSIIC